MATSMKDANHYKKDEKSLKIDTKIHYYYATLDEEGKAIYRNILGAYLNMKDSFRVDVSVDDFSTYNRMVLNEHPELFWVDSGYQYSNYGRYVMVWPRYNRDKNQVKEGLYGRMVYDITGKSTTTYRWGFGDSLVIKLYY